MSYEKSRQSFLREKAIDFIGKPFNRFNFEIARKKIMRGLPKAIPDGGLRVRLATAV